jgi:hypothetical protein
MVRQDERRHGLADLRRRLTGAISPKPLYEPIHRGGKFRPLSSCCFGEGAKLLVHGHVQIAHPPECNV